MIGSSSGVQIWLAAAPVDMRQGFDRLAARVREHLRHDPLGGHLFVFRNKSGDRLKVLFWDRDGLVIYYKRLEEGTFALPTSADGTSVELRSCELAMLLDGVELSSARRRRRYQRPA